MSLQHLDGGLAMFLATHHVDVALGLFLAKVGRRPARGSGCADPKQHRKTTLLRAAPRRVFVGGVLALQCALALFCQIHFYSLL